MCKFVIPKAIKIKLVTTTAAVIVILIVVIIPTNNNSNETIINFKSQNDIKNHEIMKRFEDRKKHSWMDGSIHKDR
jgi:hypothetical protein